MYFKNKISQFLGWANTQLCKALPVVDYRQNNVPEEYNKTVLVEAQRIYEPAPFLFFYIQKKPFWIDILNKGIDSGEVYALQFPRCFFIGRGILLNEHKQVLLESAFFQREYLYKLRNAPLIVKTIVASPEITLNNIIPLLSKLSNNYYHWTIENLIRIALLDSTDKTVREKYSLVIAENGPDFITDSLKTLLHWPEDRIIKWPNTKTASINNGILISYPVVRTKETDGIYVYPPEIFRRLNSIALKNIKPVNKYLPQYFIVSRSKARFRNLINEKELQAALSAYPVELVELESMSYAEQVQLFQQAILIIAPHGAGITNLIYCKPNTLAIELCPQREHYCQPAVYYQIATALKLQYYTFEIAPANKDNDMVADAELIKQIKKVVDSQLPTTD